MLFFRKNYARLYRCLRQAYFINGALVLGFDALGEFVHVDTCIAIEVHPTPWFKKHQLQPNFLTHPWVVFRIFTETQFAKTMCKDLRCCRFKELPKYTEP